MDVEFIGYSGFLFRVEGKGGIRDEFLVSVGVFGWMVVLFIAIGEGG